MRRFIRDKTTVDRETAKILNCQNCWKTYNSDI